MVDEIENGLEPHRVRGLLNVLRTGMGLQDNVDSPVKTANQVLATTHSPIALSELEPDDLGVVRSENGVTEIRRPDAVLRPLFRTNPGAFLARKIIVCEGKTEIGFCRALDTWWSTTQQSFAYAGAALAYGQGTNAPKTAINFAKLGYRTAYFGDSDQPLNPDQAEMTYAGICTILWEGNVAIEERVALDLPWKGFVEMVHLVLDEYGEDHMKAKLAIPFKCQPTEVPIDPNEWRVFFSDETAMRKAFAGTAKLKKAEWFKRVDQAEKLCQIVIGQWGDILQTPLGKGIAQLRVWVHD